MPCLLWAANLAGHATGPASCMRTRAMTTPDAAPTSSAAVSRIVLPAKASSVTTGSGAIAGWSNEPTPGWQPSANCVPASSAASTFTSRCSPWLAVSSASEGSCRFVSRSYAELYYLDQNDRLSREILDLMARLEKVAQVRYAGGLAAQQDVIRAQVEQSTMRNELIALDAERRQLQSKLNALVGRPTSEILAAPEQIRALPSPEQVSFAALEGRARMNNPLLRTEESQIRAAEKNRELTYKNRYPDFNVGISPIQYRGSIKEWELMVELNIPLQQDSRRAQERESEAMLAAARSRQEVVTNQVLADLYANVAGFESARRSLALTTESLLPQSELTFRSALAGYQTGKVDFATLLDAQRQIRQSKLNQIKAGVEAQKRLTEIERIVGEEQ